MFNPKDKRVGRKNIIEEFCSKHYKEQEKKIKLYKTSPNQVLIKDKNNEYKIVSKYYFNYLIQDDECETETELEDY